MLKYWKKEDINIVEILKKADINIVEILKKEDKWYRKCTITRTGKKCTLEWNSIVIKDRERDVQSWKIFKVHFKWGWNKSPFDINSVVFHFDDFNYGRRITTIFFF